MKPDRNVLKSLALISQIGISMMTPIFLCVFIGYKLDEKFHTSYWFIIFIILGVISAYRNVYYITKSYYSKPMKDEKDES